MIILGRLRPYSKTIILRTSSSTVAKLDSDPFAILALPPTASRDELHSQFFKLARKLHPSLTGKPKEYQKLVQAYESAIKTAEEKQPTPAWDGVSGMTYSQAWQGKDFWRKKWEDHWASRLANMYQHKEELDSLEDNVKLREAQYNQVRDWYTMSKGIMNEEVRAEWNNYCDLWRGQILWAKANKTNYKRFYISNQNNAGHVDTVYKEHEFWREFENSQWAEWNSFFIRAQKWVAENESLIRALHNLEGPLEAKYNFLMKERYEAALRSPADLALQAAQELKQWRTLVYKRQAFRTLRVLSRYFERSLRATFPVFLGVLFLLWYWDFQFRFTVVEPQLPPPDNAAVIVRARILDAHTYFAELFEKLQKQFSYEEMKKHLPSMPQIGKK